jgi:hypothetical protein
VSEGMARIAPPMKEGLVDRTLVHKSDERNVFIFDLRRALPMLIEEEAFARNASSLAPGDRELMDRAYPSSGPLNGEGRSRTRFFSGMAPGIPAAAVARAKASRDEEFVDLVGRKYEPERAAAPANFILREALTERECFVARNAAHFSSFSFSAADEARISAILEGWEGIGREDVFYAEMRVDPSHEYYFEHAIEHVPAMMLIEAQRQFGLACCHRYGKIPVKGKQIILKDLSIEFINYAELPFPIAIRGVVESCRWHGKEYWSELKMDIGFYQWTPIARFHFTGRSLDLRLFQKMRERKAAMLGERRFLPRRPGEFSFCVRKGDESELPKAELSDVSLGGFRAAFRAPAEKPESENMEFILHSAVTGFVMGKCRMAWLSDDGMKAGFAFTEMPAEDVRKLGEFIGAYAVHAEGREYRKNGDAYGN